METRRFDVKIVGFIRSFIRRRARAIRSEQSLKARERFVKLIRIAQAGLEQTELMTLCARGFGAQRDTDDWRVGLQIFQMRVEHPKKRVDVARRRRNG